MMHLLLLTAALAVVPALAQTLNYPVRSVTDPGVVTTRQGITPAGVHTVFWGRVHGVAFGAGPEDVWVLNAGSVYRFDWRRNVILGKVDVKGGAGLQGIIYDPAGKRALISHAVSSEARLTSVEAAGPAKLKAVTVAGKLGTYMAGVPGIAPQAGLAVVPLTANNKLAVVDLKSGKTLHTLATGIAPYGALLSADGKVAWVSNWGGRVPRPGDLTGPLGVRANFDSVVVDKRGIAASDTVSRIDLTTAAVTHTIAVELHPTAMVWDEAHARLYVANGNKDSISVIDTRENRVLRTIPLQPFTQAVTGVSPMALAISADGARLYAACGGINAVAVIATATGKIDGLIPTAWVPNGLSLSADGKFLAIATMLGAGSAWKDEPEQRFVHANRGSVAVVELPDAAQLAGYTTAVAENNHLPLGPLKPPPAARPGIAPAAIPSRAGEPSLIEHVVYIIKENRTYDQVLGDMPKGNGEESLVMFGNKVTPNQHRLSDQFVLLDNFYATGGNSADGHQWVTQANEVDYCLWPGYLGRSYPFDGADAMAIGQGGAIWDAALKAKKTVRVFGEYAGSMRVSTPGGRLGLLERWKNGEDFNKEWNITAPLAPLNAILAHQYPSYTTGIPDVIRAQIFLTEFAQWKKSGRMPNLTLIALPSNHTNGTLQGSSSPRAMVADNDLALGKIVEELSHSPFWKKMAIFVVEDDAQNGVDHVDGHRTVALAVSPYTRRGQVDSTFYAHQSILKTIELILGLPTMSLFDLIANDMRNIFTNAADFTPYDCVQPEQSLYEVNLPINALRGRPRADAIASGKMRWDVPDAAPTELLNRILWRNVRGDKTPYPKVKRSVFSPLSVDVDDDDR